MKNNYGVYKANCIYNTSTLSKNSLFYKNATTRFLNVLADLVRKKLKDQNRLGDDQD